MKGLNSQRGVAAIAFVLIVPGLFGLFTLGIEGSRYMSEKARLADTLEVAALAVAANGNSASEANKALVASYITANIKSVTVSPDDIVFEKKSCLEVYGADCGKPGVYDKSGMHFNQYQLTANVKFSSWFPGTEVLQGFDKELVMGGQAIARRYQQDALDVVFVADFSGSMGNSWNGTQKYKGVVTVIQGILDELDKYNSQNIGSEANKAAFVGFSSSVTQAKSGNYYRYNYTERECVVYGWWWCYEWEMKVQEALDNIFNTNYYSEQRTSYPDYYLIPLTDNFDSFNPISSFEAGGGTASYEGVIAAARLLHNNPVATNSRKLIVILSDGEDNYRDDANDLYGLNKPYGEGLCDIVVETLSTGDITTKMTVIGFDYDLSSNPGLSRCVGTDNVFKAENYDEIYNKILELIVEEIGHIYTSGN